MKKWIYRPYVSTFDLAMKYLKEFDSLYEMFDYLSNEYKDNKKRFSIYLYFDCLDTRCNWDITYIVCYCNLPVGYCTEK